SLFLLNPFQPCDCLPEYCSRVHTLHYHKHFIGYHTNTFNNISSSIEHLTLPDSMAILPFVVTPALSKVYYRGLPSQPSLIATTKPDPFKAPTGPEAYTVPLELRCLSSHPLTTVWDYGLANQLRQSLNAMGVNWSSLDAIHISSIGETSGPAIAWIGVEFGALSFEEGSKVATNCQSIIDSHGIGDCYVEIRESCVIRQIGNRFLDPVHFSDSTFTARDPYTATLGIPMCAKNRPWAEGTGGFYISAGGNDKNIYLVTARHVVLPQETLDNQEYYRHNENMPPEEVLILGTSAFNKKIEAIDYEITGQEYAMTDAKERIELADSMENSKLIKEGETAVKQLKDSEENLEALRALRHEISTQWAQKENRVFGTLIWAPPISLSTEPDHYTLDLAVIRVNPGQLDTNNYRGNTINLGNKFSRHHFMEKIYLDHTRPPSFKFPTSRLVKLQDQVPESELMNPSMRDAKDQPCLVVFKNGAKTGTTIGKANPVSSFTRTYFGGHSQESREWPVIPTNRDLEAFSDAGDSGSCVADAFCRIGGIITGGSQSLLRFDITYVTPISYIMKVLHNTRHFKHAHLNPTLPSKGN
ncbi:hypothetical protein HOY82DRAFT_624136, partial [Tuber indicum]